MSDRVHFLTNAPAMAVDAYGCSGFPFRIRTAAAAGVSVGPGTFHPIGLPLEVANSTNASCARMYHRGKRLSLDTDFQFTTGAGTFVTTNGSLTQTSGPTRELHLIDGLHNKKEFAIDIGGLSGFAILFDTDEIVSDSGLFYPQMQIGTPSGPTLTQVDGGGFSHVDATLDGETFPLYYDPSLVISMILTHFDLTWDLFWPYAALNASAIYNTANGLQLQDPRN